MSVERFVSALRRDVRWSVEAEAGRPHDRSPEQHAQDKDVVLAAMTWVHRTGVEAWPFVASAIESAADDDEVLSHIGAGDLETLIVWHGDELIDDIEARAPSSRALRVALANVWGSGAAEERIARLLAVHGPPSRYWVWTVRQLVERIDDYKVGRTDLDALGADVRAAFIAGEYAYAETRDAFERFLAAVDDERSSHSDSSGSIGKDPGESFASRLQEFQTFLSDAIDNQRRGEAAIRLRMQRLKEKRGDG